MAFKIYAASTNPLPNRPIKKTSAPGVTGMVAMSRPGSDHNKRLILWIICYQIRHKKPLKGHFSGHKYRFKEKATYQEHIVFPYLTLSGISLYITKKSFFSRSVITGTASPTGCTKPDQNHYRNESPFDR
jgi:hypothetical protein